MDRETAIELKENSFFSNIPVSKIQQLNEVYFEKCTFNKSDIIIKQNAPPDYVYLIISGIVKISKYIHNHEVTLTKRFDNSYIGELGVLENKIRSASVIADTHIDALRINNKNFSIIMEHLPQIKNNIIHDLAARLRESDVYVTEQVQKSRILAEMNKQISIQKTVLEKYSSDLKKAYSELEKKNEELYKLATTDMLTQIYNRRFVIDYFKKEFSKAKRHNAELSIIIADIDDFKSFNDTYGHLIGDFVLKNTAEIMEQNLREEDILGRYGGEEFLIILPGTEIKNAYVAAEKIREAVCCQVHKTENLELKISLSLGASDIGTKNPETIDEMLKYADFAMYESKRQGKNKTTLFSDIIKKGDLLGI